MRTMTIQVRKKGTITLPREIRERYGLSEGDVFTLVDLGDGSFLLSPFVSKVAQLGDQAAEAIRGHGQGKCQPRRGYSRVGRGARSLLPRPLCPILNRRRRFSSLIAARSSPQTFH